MRSMATAASISLLLWVVYDWMPSYAQGNPLLPDIGTTVTPRATLPTWESYPSGLLRSKGEQQQDINNGETFEVIGKKVVGQLFFGGNQYYLELKPISPASTESQTSFWVFQGREGGELCPNLIECNQENSGECSCDE